MDTLTSLKYVRNAAIADWREGWHGRVALALAACYILLFSGFLFLDTANHRHIFYLSLPLTIVLLANRSVRAALPWRNPVIISCGLFIIFTALSVLWSGDQDGRLFEKAKIVLFLPLGMLGLYALLRRHPRFWDVLCVTYVAVAALTSLALIVLNGHEFYTTPGFRLNGWGRAENSVQCAMLYGCAVLAVLFGGMFKTTSWKARLPLLLIPFGVMMMTASRGPLLAVFLCTCGLYMVRGRARRVALVGAGALIAACALFVSMPSLRSLPMLQRADSARFGIWDKTWDIVAQKPVFGHGVASKFYYPTMNEWYGHVFNAGHPHNLYLATLVQTGFVGLGLFLIMVGCVGWQTWRNASHTRDDWPLALIVAGLLLGLVDFGGYYINLSNEWLVFWFPAVAIIAEARRQSVSTTTLPLV